MYFILEKKLKAYHASSGKGLDSYAHLHSHIEIVLMYDGCSHGFADDLHADIEKGDLFIAFPNQIHYYLDKNDKVQCSLLILSPDMCPEFNTLFKTYIPKSPVLKNAMSNQRIVSTIETIIALRKDQREFADTLIRGYALVLFSEIFRSIALVKHSALSTDLAKDIISYCYDNYKNDISLQSVADYLHTSRYYISHMFSKRLKVGFSDYINSLRIRAACELLKSGEQSITEIAYDVGYNSVRTFNRCFLKIRGMTPKQYRNKKLAKKSTLESQ